MTAVAGKQVVVTGIIPGHSRVTAEQALRDAGAFVSGTVTKHTDVLVTGAKVGKAKTDKAAALGVTVVPWEQVSWDVDYTVAAVSADGEVTVIAEVTHTTLTPKQIAPMLALDGELPVGDDWTYEVKWDGYRCIATVHGGAVAMMSRSGKTDYAAQFPNVAAELALLPNCTLDGEIVVLKNGEGGVFADLTGPRKGVATFVAFDCIDRPTGGLGVVDFRALPLSDRRFQLAEILKLASRPLAAVAQSPIFPDGPALLAYCAEHNMEGVVSKRASSRYEDGSRSGAWVKTKVRLEQEFVVVGYSAGDGRRAATFGALLLAYHAADGHLVYAGKVGTGWDDPEHERLYALLAEHVQNDGSGDDPVKDAVWIGPHDIVVQVEFQRWTPDGLLWHPSYKGQRHDKPASEVVRET